MVSILVGAAEWDGEEENAEWLREQEWRENQKEEPVIGFLESPHFIT